MDKVKIMRLCNEIENIATEIQERTMKDSYYMAQTIINRVLVIVAEISAKPKSNADHIRQMMDEELATQLEAFICNKVEECRREDISCVECALKWLKQEVKTNDER